jgi:hypothetical protein
MAVAAFSHIQLTGSSRTANRNLCNVADSFIGDRNASSPGTETARSAILKGGRASLVVLHEVDCTTLKVQPPSHEKRDGGVANFHGRCRDGQGQE